MNYLNISLVDSRGVGAKAKAGARASLKSGPEESEIAKPGLLRALSPYAIVSLGAESPSGSLGVADPYKRFFQ